MIYVPRSKKLTYFEIQLCRFFGAARSFHISRRFNFDDIERRRGEDAPPLPGRTVVEKKRFESKREDEFAERRAPRRYPRGSGQGEEDYLRQFPERTSFRSARKDRRPQKSLQKAERYLDRMESREDGEVRRSGYRNDKNVREEDLKKVEERRARIEAETPSGPRIESDETPVEPPDFTLSIASARPEDAPKLASVGALSKLERRMSRLKPVTERERKAEQEAELLERAKRAAAEAIKDPLTNCWGCGVDFQTEEPTTMGYVPKLKLDRYKLEKELFDLQTENDLANPSTGPNAEFVPTAEMLEIERMLLGLEEDEEVFDAAPTPSAKKNKTEGAKRHERPERVLCERCWSLRHKSKAVSVSVSAEYFKEVVQPIKQLKTRPLILKMVDLFDFHGSFIPSFRKYIGNNRVLIVASKYDLLPKGVHPERIRSWVSTECRKFGIDPVGVALISHTGYGVRELADQLEHHRQGSDVYVMGSANVGKSTFINLLIDIFKGPKEKKVTVSPVPGTTLNFLSLPIGSSAFLYDTPGIITSKQIYNYLSGEEMKKVMPKKQIHPSVYRLSPGTTIFIGGLARFDYLEGPPLVYFTLFASNEIYIHKTATDKADELYRTKVGTMLTPPSQPETLSSWPGFEPEGEVHEIENDDGNWQRACADIVFSGLGWVSVTMKGVAKVRTFYPPGCRVGVRPPLMPFESRLGVLPNPRFNMKPSSVAARPQYEEL